MMRRLSPPLVLLLAFALLACSTGPTDRSSPTESESASASPGPSTGPTEERPDASPADEASARGASGLLLATQAASDGLVFVDPARRQGAAVVDRVVVGAAPWGVAVHHRSRTAYVATAVGVAVVDLVARERTRLVRYRNQPDEVEHGEFRAGGMGIAVSPDGSRVYVAVHRAEGTSVLEVLDTSSGRIVGAVPVGLRPFDVLVSEDGGHVYTVDHDSFTVHIVDTDDLRARSVQVAPFGTEGGLGSWEKPHYAALAGNGDLLLPYQGLRLARIDPDTGEVTTSPMTADTHQHGVTLTPDGRRLLVVGTGPFGNATGPPSLTVRTMGTGAEQVVPMDRPHETVTTWRGPRGRLHAVLSGGYTREGWWNGATVVDLTTLESRRIRIPGRPQAMVRSLSGSS